MPTPTTNQPTVASRLRRIAQLEDQLARRRRLEYAMLALGIIIGIALVFIIGMPPVNYAPPACTIGAAY